MALTQARAAGAFTGGRYGSFAGRGPGGGAHPVGTLTQPRGHGAFTGKRYGSFDGRAGGGAHPVDAITQPRAFGAFSGKRYGSFAGRETAGGHPVGRITQPRTHAAFTGRRYGSFAGRTEALPPAPGPDQLGGRPFFLPLPAIDAQRLGLVEADEWLMLIAAAAYRHRVLH